MFAQLGSYGMWWQSLQKEDEKEKHFFHKDETASRYWPLGKNVLYRYLHLHLPYDPLKYEKE